MCIVFEDSIESLPDAFHGSHRQLLLGQPRRLRIALVRLLVQAAAAAAVDRGDAVGVSPDKVQFLIRHVL